MNKFKKSIMAVALVATLAGGSLTFSACGTNDSGKVFKKVTDLYGFVGASTVSLLDGFSASVNTNSLSQEETEKIGEINKHMNMLEGFIGGNRPVNVEIQNSDNEVYQQKLKIEISSMTGKQTMEMLYNETRLETDEEIADSNEDEEIESKLTGIIKMNNETFDFNGKKEIEQDEIEVEFTVNITNGNYVVFKQETETGEQEFSYMVYDSNDQLIDMVEFEIEIENNEIEIEYKLLDANQNVQKYKMKKITDEGKQKIKISYTVNNVETIVKLTIETVDSTTYYVYNINDGSQIIKFEEGSTTPVSPAV